VGSHGLLQLEELILNPELKNIGAGGEMTFASFNSARDLHIHFCSQTVTSHVTSSFTDTGSSTRSLLTSRLKLIILSHHLATLERFWQDTVMEECPSLHSFARFQTYSWYLKKCSRHLRIETLRYTLLIKYFSLFRT